MSHEQNRGLIDALAKCAAECNHCATACLDEQDVKELARCIKLVLTVQKSVSWQHLMFPGVQNMHSIFLMNVLKSVRLVPMNVKNILTWSIAGNVLTHADPALIFVTQV